MTQRRYPVHPVDKYVGSKLRVKRMLTGMSQTELANTVGLTFQQIQKYERGANRISASRLYQFCSVFKVPFDFFLQGFGEDLQSPLLAQKGMSDNGQEAFSAEVKLEEKAEDLMSKNETIKLVRAYYSIKDVKLRKQLLEMAKTMAKQ